MLLFTEMYFLRKTAYKYDDHTIRAHGNSRLIPIELRKCFDLDNPCYSGKVPFISPVQ